MIDTSYLYKCEGDSGLPSVRDITEQILRFKMPEVHDSVMDSRAALQATIWLINNTLVPPTPAPLIVRSQSLSNNSLLIHRIPNSQNIKITTKIVYKMLVERTGVVPVKVLVTGTGNTTSTGNSGGNSNGNNNNNNNNSNIKMTIQYTTPHHCRLAFDSIHGPNRPDKAGKAQKRVYLKGGGYVCVRASYSE